MLNQLRIARRGPGRPRSRPVLVRADKAYSAPRHPRPTYAAAASSAVIPEPADQAGHRKRRGSRGGRPVTYDQARVHRPQRRPIRLSASQEAPCHPRQHHYRVRIACRCSKLPLSSAVESPPTHTSKVDVVEHPVAARRVPVAPLRPGPSVNSTVPRLAGAPASTRSEALELADRPRGRAVSLVEVELDDLVGLARRRCSSPRPTPSPCRPARRTAGRRSGRRS